VSRISAAQVLDRPEPDVDTDASDPASPRSFIPAGFRPFAHRSPDTRACVPRPTPRRRLPHPPGRRAPLWFAALVAGALLAAVPGLTAGPQEVTISALDYGLGNSADVNFAGGMEDAGVRRGITEAEAQARLGELAASRAAREPKTVVPTQGRLSTCFCMRWGQMHYGIDLAAPLGTPIVAAADGVVLKTGRASGYGNAIYIEDTEGFVHVYGHMRYWNVEVGQVVHAGEQIAKVGNEGRSTGPHLHWEVRRDDMHGKPLDPQDWLADHGIHL
jgi:murein DD-endopeptidase MepM/ murein hydrolase activator NlpD